MEVLLRVAGATSLEGAVDLNSTLTVAGSSVTCFYSLSVGGAANFLAQLLLAGTNVQAVNARVCASAYYGDGSNFTGINSYQW